MIKQYRWYILFFFLLIAFTIATGFNGLYGQDSYEYLRFTKCLSIFIKTGAAPGSFFWPLLYPICGALFSFIFNPVFALQLLSILSFIGAAIYVDKIIELLYKPDGKTRRVFTFLFFLLSPYLLRASLVVMSDMLAAFFVTASYYYCFKYKAAIEGKYFFWFVTFAMAAIATRYAAIIVLVAPGISIKLNFLRHFKWKAFALSAIAVCTIALPHFLLRYNNPLAFIHHDWVTEWSPTNFFKNTFVTADGNAHYTFYNIVYVFFNLIHPAFCFAGLIFLAIYIIYLKENKSASHSVLGISIMLYALFLAGIPLQNMRFLLLSFPLIAVLFFPAYAKLRKYLSDKKNLMNGVMVLVILAQLGLFYRVFKPFYRDNKVDKQIATEMLKYPNTPIYTFSIEGALRAYEVNNEIVNLYNVKLDTVKNLQGDKLVLFNENQFSEEWRGQNPMLNWEYLQKNNKLNKIEELPDGWALYKAF
jgi:hypothetical protein